MNTQQKPTPANVDEYIAAYPKPVRDNLEKIRKTISKSAPEADEVISYGMPAYKYHGMLTYFAAHTNHYSIYPFSSAIKAFRDRLLVYQTSKGTVQFPMGKPIPVKLIAEMIRFRVKENLEKKLAKDKKKG